MQDMRFITIAIACAMLAGCQSRLSYAPAPGVHVSVSGYTPSGSSTLPTGNGGHYKTGRPYQVGGRWYYPLASAAGYDQIGTASWYGRDFHGRKTANGERYDMHALSAAHKTLPLPTLVRVTNLENGRSVVVRVNDRGPFARNRLIDLSYAAARSLGFVNKGTARVRVQALGNKPTRIQTRRSVPPAPAGPAASPAGGMYVQIGAFSSQNNARRLRDTLQRDYPAIRIYHGTAFYRVRIGPFSDVQQIEQTVISLRNSGFDNAIVVIE